MSKTIKIILKIIKILTIVTGILFVIYFWNLDQKLMAWAYTQVNRIFDRKNARFIPYFSHRSSMSSFASTNGGAYLDKAVYPSQISDLIIALIIYLCGFVLFFKSFINARISAGDGKKAKKGGNA